MWMTIHVCRRCHSHEWLNERGLRGTRRRAMSIYVCNGCGALAPDARQPTTKCACGTHDWRRFTRSK